MLFSACRAVSRFVSVALVSVVSTYGSAHMVGIAFSFGVRLHHA